MSSFFFLYTKLGSKYGGRGCTWGRTPNWKPVQKNEFVFTVRVCVSVCPPEAVPSNARLIDVVSPVVLTDRLAASSVAPPSTTSAFQTSQAFVLSVSTYPDLWTTAKYFTHRCSLCWPLKVKVRNLVRFIIMPYSSFFFFKGCLIISADRH